MPSSKLGIVDGKLNKSSTVVTSKSFSVKDSTRAEGVVDTVFASIKSNKDMGGIVEATVGKSLFVDSSLADDTVSVFVRV